MTTLIQNLLTAIRTISGACFCKVDYTVPARLLKTVCTVKDADGEVIAERVSTKAAKALTVDGGTVTSKTNPLWADKDRIEKVVTGASLNLGGVYEHIINGRLDKKELDPNFTAKGMRGKVECSPKHKNLCQSTDGSKVYVRYMPMPNDGMTVRYQLDGNDVTSIVRDFRPTSKAASTQTAAGLSEAEAILWRTLNVANITSMTIAGVTIS